MKRLLPLLLCALPAPALAQIDYGASGYIDLRLVSPADEPSWLQGGLGKTRYGKDDSHFQFAGAVGQGYVLLTPEILAVAVLRIEPQQRTFVDVLESYVRYRPVSTSPWRWLHLMPKCRSPARRGNVRFQSHSSTACPGTRHTLRPCSLRWQRHRR